jgi:hypothetical protein
MIVKRTAIIAVAAAGLACLGCAASAGPASKIGAALASRTASADAKSALTLIDDRNSDRRPRYRHRRFAKHRYGEYQGYGYGRRNSGPPYSSCYMKCIYSSHPADFCRDVASEHFCY